MSRPYCIPFQRTFTELLKNLIKRFDFFSGMLKKFSVILNSVDLTLQIFHSVM
jgi:hypothetical protein